MPQTMEDMAGGFGVLGMIFFLFLMLRAFFWILMSFAIFGTKCRLCTLIAGVREQNALLVGRNALKNVGVAYAP